MDSSLVLALLLGLLLLLCLAAISAVFSISVYVECATPILTRFMIENDCKPGPFSLGVLIRQNALGFGFCSRKAGQCQRAQVTVFGGEKKCRALPACHRYYANTLEAVTRLSVSVNTYFLNPRDGNNT
ncbi:hypothetical protein J3R82DRAFT_11842 [Butyriboletus roseoflavus]|nr:hypothetical protein J3R82DRAFT_11842 [Butyriboletus roseoflavus]